MTKELATGMSNNVSYLFHCFYDERIIFQTVLLLNNLEDIPYQLTFCLILQPQTLMLFILLCSRTLADNERDSTDHF
jgi:hypothetical protein